MTATLVQGDTAPTIQGFITNSLTGLPTDLTDAASVTIQVRLAADRRFLINGVCVIDDAVLGQVHYDLEPDDLDFAGDCQVRFLVEYNDGVLQHTTPPVELVVENQ